MDIGHYHLDRRIIIVLHLSPVLGGRCPTAGVAAASASAGVASFELILGNNVSILLRYLRCNHVNQH